MLRLTNSFKNLTLSTECFAANYNNLQIVRWRRKPRWLPKAKTKIFRVHPRPVIGVDEAEELRKLFNTYRTQVKSIRKYLMNKYNVENLESTDMEAHMKAFEEDFDNCNKMNEEWNKERKEVRDKRVAEIMEKEAEIARQRLEDRKKIWEEQRKLAEEIVRREKEAAKSFITPDKLDEAIEKAIANPVDYNFAMDLEGNRIEGRETKPTVVSEEKARVQQ